MMDHVQQLKANVLYVSKKYPTGPTERPPKPEYLIAHSILLRGPLVRSHSIFDGMYLETPQVEVKITST